MVGDYSGEYLHEALTERAYGRLSSKEANPDIRASADQVEKFLGGKIEPQDIKPRVGRAIKNEMV